MDAVPTGLEPREAAWNAVTEVLKRRSPLTDVFAEIFSNQPLAPRDESLARAIATVTFRRLGSLRAILEKRLDNGLPQDQRLLNLLAIGAAQILVLDVPDHAVVDTAVMLCRSQPNLRHASGLVNAVLRRIVRERDAILAEDDASSDVPDWLRARWSEHFGEETMRAIARAHREGSACVDLTIAGDPDDWAQRLGGKVLPTGSVRLANRTAVSLLEGYDEGAWWVQDAAAAIPARLLGAKDGERIADLCAAPGGKTAQLAMSGAHVLAVDRSAKRLERLKQNLSRLGLKAEVLAVDATRLKEPPFDAILLDAPCSATGTLRRHPEIAWIKDERDIAKLSDLQKRLLEASVDLIKPGGRLVYCTCSLEPEEGENQIAAFLEKHSDFSREPIAASEIGGLSELLNPQGDLRSLPTHLRFEKGEARNGIDGFYASRLRRR